MNDSAAVVSDPLQDACQEMDAKISAAVAQTKRSNNRLIETALDLARERRKIIADKLITDDAEVADEVQDLTGKYTAMIEHV